MIGGGEIYRALLPRVGRLYLTHVAASPPATSPSRRSILAAGTPFRLKRVPAGPADSVASRFVVYERGEGGAAFR